MLKTQHSPSFSKHSLCFAGDDYLCIITTLSKKNLVLRMNLWWTTFTFFTLINMAVSVWVLLGAHYSSDLCCFQVVWNLPGGNRGHKSVPMHRSRPQSGAFTCRRPDGERTHLSTSLSLLCVETAEALLMFSSGIQILFGRLSACWTRGQAHPASGARRGKRRWVLHSVLKFQPYKPVKTGGTSAWTARVGQTQEPGV